MHSHEKEAREQERRANTMFPAVRRANYALPITKRKKHDLMQ